MEDKDKLAVLKVQLGIATSAYDTILTGYLHAACQEMQREGITLQESDLPLELMYAAWLWRKRDTMESMPRMLRYLLNNRIFSEKGKTDG